MYRSVHWFALICAVAISACRGSNAREPLFSKLNPTKTGIQFINDISGKDSTNILDYIYYYNGGGVALGDFNNDALIDVFLVANRGLCKLYRNRGAMRFDEVSFPADTTKGSWKTGVVVADINNDGLLDIYISQVGGYKRLHGTNRLYINEGDFHFGERSAEYGLNIEGLNTQSTFFDYDKDGDLDMFLVNHSIHSTDNYASADRRMVRDRLGGDRLLRNDSINGRIVFSDVTADAGIFSSSLGYGLNVSISDLNLDGYPDIYVSNDFHEHDYYYVNNRNGTFSEIGKSAFAHQSRFSMGSAIADVNNDGWSDILTLDMLPDNEHIVKTTISEDAPDIFEYKYKLGYNYQLTRNCLHVNTGGGTSFVDAALYAGIAATDWSWSPLIADFDNDGHKDIFVSSGIVRRPNDLDYLKYGSGAVSEVTNPKADSIAIMMMPEGSACNRIFRGSDSLRFIDETENWLGNTKGISTGAAYADLDNDGDIDFVTNNINEPAGVYENRSSRVESNRWLSVALIGPPKNFYAIGAKLWLIGKSGFQFQELNVAQGFQSSAIGPVHFGLGGDTTAKRILIHWPDGSIEELKDVAVDQKITVRWKPKISQLASNHAITNPEQLPAIGYHYQTQALFDASSIGTVHSTKSNYVTDFSNQPLLPHSLGMYSGAIAVGDFNMDGNDDFFVPGRKENISRIYMSALDSFKVDSKSFITDAPANDVNAAALDVDGDDDFDLYVSGEAANKSADRLYLNDSFGRFTKLTLPELTGGRSVIVPCDFDRDGDQDIFAGTYTDPNNYGSIRESYLLLNVGSGRFVKANESVAAGLAKIGMVTSAVWSDLNNDGWSDLVVVGEWMPVTVFINANGRLQDRTTEYGLDRTHGLWNSVIATDVNNDGKVDLVAGNRGHNTKLSASDSEPLLLYLLNDVTSGRSNQIITIKKHGRYHTFLGKDDIERQMPSLRKNYFKYKDFSQASIQDLFGAQLKSSVRLHVNTLTSTSFINNGKTFRGIPLPPVAQLGPVCAMLNEDFNADGLPDLFIAGNLIGVSPYEGKYDALMPTILYGQGDGRFNGSVLHDSTLKMFEEVRSIKKLKTLDDRDLILIGCVDRAPLLLTRRRLR
jgi:enediyne biosynthesis protein E4